MYRLHRPLSSSIFWRHISLGVHLNRQNNELLSYISYYCSLYLYCNTYVTKVFQTRLTTIIIIQLFKSFYQIALLSEWSLLFVQVQWNIFKVVVVCYKCVLISIYLWLKHWLHTLCRSIDQGCHIEAKSGERFELWTSRELLWHHYDVTFNPANLSSDTWKYY